MDERAKPGDLCMADAMPFQQHHEYRTHVPIEDLINDERFFLNVKDNLRPGDSITICRYADNTFRKLIEVADVRVIETSNVAVRIHQRGEVERVAEPESSNAPSVAAKTDPTGGAQFADNSDWTAKHRQFGKWEVFDGEGNLVAENLDKESAFGVARGDLPVPDPGKKAA